jgi:hypothetical protein
LPGGPDAAPSPAGVHAGGALAPVLAFVAVLLGTTLLGVAAGFIWAAVAPRALLVVVGRGSADVVNPETTAFIAQDAWFVLLCVIGGAISGLLGYLFAVRRHGVSAMAGVLAGAVAAALIARWIEEQQSGAAAFNHLLGISRPGVFLRAPVAVSGVGALAFWPLAAGLCAGGFEAVQYFRERRRAFSQRSACAATPHYGLAAAQIPPLGSRGSAGLDGVRGPAGPSASSGPPPDSAGTHPPPESAGTHRPPESGHTPWPSESGGASGQPDPTAPERASWPVERYGPGRTGDSRE